MTARRRLAEIARELWLPRTASREEVLAAIAELSDGRRREHLLAKVQAIPVWATPLTEKRT